MTRTERTPINNDLDLHSGGVEVRIFRYLGQRRRREQKIRITVGVL